MNYRRENTVNEHSQLQPLPSSPAPETHLGVVSLTFRQLSKKLSRNLCIAQIVLVIRISSWNFVRVPKVLLWAHIQIFTINVISGVVYFPENILWSSQNVSETGPSCISKKLHGGNDENPLARMIGINTFVPGLLPACAHSHGTCTLNHCEKLPKYGSDTVVLCTQWNLGLRCGNQPQNTIHLSADVPYDNSTHKKDKNIT